jgi:hypothetical protein
VEFGDTLNEYGLEVIPEMVVCADPSEYVRFHGGVPVKLTVRGVDDPLHMVLVPEIEAVGLGWTVITALPDKSSDSAEQAASDRAVTV